MTRRSVCACGALVTLLVLLAGACGGTPKPPMRGVLEQDIAGWKYRRYQQVVDIEVWVPDNPAVAYTATYVRESAEKRGRIERADLASAFVTRYQERRGVSRGLILFVRRLAQEGGYTVEEDEREGVRLVAIQGTDEAWVMWATHDHIVKIGGRGLNSVPEDLIEVYGERYPSRLASGSLEAPIEDEEPAGQTGDKKANEKGSPKKNAPAGDAEEEALDKPAPDWDKYTPGEPGASSKDKDKPENKKK